eukprot:Sspe_Gene.55897::Locus_30747_Transcript_1_1_Confidence_1.000_Length_3351::g.55897::m.55897/K14326/UPF1, RENT1; regulator of nonsense transcripts 1
MGFAGQVVDLIFKEGSPNIYCPICETYCPDKPSYNDHVAGRRHQKKLRALSSSGQPIPDPVFGVVNPHDAAQGGISKRPYLPTASPSPPPMGVPLAAAPDPTKPPSPQSVWCAICQLWASDLGAFKEHLKGKKHRQKEKGTGRDDLQLYHLDPAERAMQQSYKRQYLGLVRDVLEYVRHMRGLLKEEDAYEKATVSVRINSTDKERLASQGLAFLEMELASPDAAKKGEVMFTSETKLRSVSADTYIGSTVYITPMESDFVSVEDRSKTMIAELVEVGMFHLVVKGMTGKGRPMLGRRKYRIDLGVPTVPMERMRATLKVIVHCHIIQLRLLGVSDRLNLLDYLSDDDDDVFLLEGTVHQLGILEPFSELSWCFFHKIQESINDARRHIHDMSQRFASLPHALHCSPGNLESGPTKASMQQHSRAPHKQLGEFLLRTPRTDPQLQAQGHNLNASQLEAVAKVIEEGRKLTLIQGPPGTGKTTTGIAILCEWVRRYRGPILATANSNTGLNHLMRGLLAKGVKCLRVGRFSGDPDTAAYSLEAYLDAETMNHERKDLLARASEIRERIDKAGQTGESVSRLGAEFKEVTKKLKFGYDKNKLIRTVMNKCEVVCATCIGAGSQLLTGISFPFVLLDEATQAHEVASLVPITRGSVQVVMIGDQAQLPPTVTCYEAARKGLDVSLFDRMISSGVDVHMLNIQYRMHPSISRFSSVFFYNSRLNDGVTELDRTLPPGILPNNQPVSCIHVAGEERARGTSRYNQSEVVVLSQLLRTFRAANINWDAMGVITPYSAQVSEIRTMLTSNFGSEAREQLEVKSVDGFQGREKDIIVLSLVRANTVGNLGFVSEWRRINVSITRAKYGLVVIGCIPTLLNSPLWFDWITFHRASVLEYNPSHGTFDFPQQQLVEQMATAVRPEPKTYEDQTRDVLYEGSAPQPQMPSHLSRLRAAANLTSMPSMPSYHPVHPGMPPNPLLPYGMQYQPSMPMRRPAEDEISQGFRPTKLLRTG